MTRGQLADIDEQLTRVEDGTKDAPQEPALDEPSGEPAGAGGEEPAAVLAHTARPEPSTEVPAHRRAWRQPASADQGYSR